MANLKDVARRAGVSIATVSRVINGMNNVDPHTVKQVSKAINELNYKPSKVAQRLRNTSMKSNFIGLILPDIQNPFYIDVIKGVEEYLYKLGYAVVVGNYSQDEEKAHLYIDIFRSESVSGFIIAPVLGSEDKIRRLIDAGNPVVCVDRGLADMDIDLVVSDNERGAFNAVEYLIKSGHTRIAHIAGSKSIPTTVQRIEGYIAAMTKYGIEVPENYIMSRESNQESGKLLTETLLGLEHPPSAILTGNNLITLGVLEAIHNKGLSIPGDISVIGFDDMPWSDSLNPPLTAVRQPAYEIGRRAAELLCQRIDEQDLPSAQLELKTELIVRNSTSKLS